MKRIIFFIIFIIAVLYCNAVEDVLVFNTNTESKNLIDEAEKLMLDYRFSNNIESLKTAKEIILKLEALAVNNKYFEALIFGLYGELEVVSENLIDASNFLPQIEKRNKNEELLYVLKAELEFDSVKKEKIITAGIVKSKTSGRLKILLALNYLAGGKYKEAAGLFDEAFINLPDFYGKYYKTLRDLSFQFIDSKPVNKESLKIIMKRHITVSDLLLLLKNESNLLSHIAGSNKMTLTEIFKKLKNENYFYIINKLTLDDLIERKDVAYFFIHIVSFYEKDINILAKYIVKDEDFYNSDLKGYLQDVKPTEYYYSAALVLVEREITTLSGGGNFLPDENISGLKIFEILKKMKALYQK